MGVCGWGGLCLSEYARSVNVSRCMCVCANVCMHVCKRVRVRVKCERVWVRVSKGDFECAVGVEPYVSEMTKN